MSDAHDTAQPDERPRRSRRDLARHFVTGAAVLVLGMASGSVLIGWLQLHGLAAATVAVIALVIPAVMIVRSIPMGPARVESRGTKARVAAEHLAQVQRELDEAGGREPFDPIAWVEEHVGRTHADAFQLRPFTGAASDAYEGSVRRPAEPQALPAPFRLGASRGAA